MELEHQHLIEKLNDQSKDIRLESLRLLMRAVKSGTLSAPVTGDDVNNHIHTTYSFSPYSPSKAVWMAYRSGLKSAGIMDHDSICGAEEFIEAGSIAGIAATIGVECRTDFSRTRLNGKRINNPDQLSNAYIALHGIPHTQIHAVQEYFEPLIRARQNRNLMMTDRINNLLQSDALKLNYEKDVVPLSNSHDGGSVTERHLLFALSLKLIAVFGRGESLLKYLTNTLKIDISSKLKSLLSDWHNQFYEYDLLGLLKGELVKSIYVDAGDECPDIREVVRFAKKHCCIIAYAYLGDVQDSVTGDKKTQKFEDEYLDDLITLLKELGIEAVTYMPSRNNKTQLSRIRNLCSENGFLQISGEDINSPRQPFICEELRKPEFYNLMDATWALIGHEQAATKNLQDGFFSQQTISRFPNLNERILKYKEIGFASLKD